MRIFVTGASGFIGSAVVPELLRHGHEVLGLARSDASAEAIAATGAEVQRGELADLDSLRAGAEASDGVIHLGFIHDFADFAGSVQTDRTAIATFGDVLEGTGRPLVIASGLLGLAAPGVVATERDMPGESGGPRAASAADTLALADRGVRSVVVRLAPTVHGEGDGGFVASIIAADREHGAAAHVGDGTNRWPALHRLDAAGLFRLAAEGAPDGSVLHGTAEDGVPMGDVAQVIGRHLDLPLRSVDGDEAAEHFGWLAPFVSANLAASSTLTQELLGWTPTHQGLLADLEEGHYFA